MSSSPSEPRAGSPGLTVRRTQKDRRNATAHALLAAARQLVADRGVDQTSVADVGERAGYSRGSVNHRFGSKKVLLQRLARETQQSVEATFRESGVLPSQPSTPALKSLIELANVYLRWVEQAEGDARAFFTMWGAAIPTESTLREEFVAFDDHFRVSLGELISVGKEDGSVRPEVDPSGAAVVIAGMIRGVAAQRLIAPELVDLETAHRAIESFVRHGIGLAA
ncbi:TetR/AcrR family transcriptional regulator [Rhodococcus triatomae]